MKRFLLLFFAFAISLIFSNSAFAEAFYINNYDVKIDVSENNVLTMEESLDVFFQAPRHGIVRTIPIKYNVQYPDGSKYQNRAYVSDMEVFEKTPNGEQSVHSKDYKKNNYYEVKIGNADKLVNGEVNYLIKYKLHLNNDKLKDKDEFYFNVIGTQWDTEIKNASFTITMPKEFDASKAGLSVGKYGTEGYDTSDGQIDINGRNISGKTLRTLGNNEGVTVRIELPEGYFVKNNDLMLYKMILTAVLMILLMSISVLIWYLFGKDEPIIPVVNFYPEKNKNSAEIGTEYDNYADTKDIVSLIFYLASKGYIKIEDKETTFTLEKLKAYDGTNKTEKMFMKALFEGGNNSVTKEMLEASRSFYKTCSKIKKELEKKTKLNMFDKNSCTKGKLSILIFSVTGIILSTLYALNSFSFSFIQSLLSESGQIIILVFPIAGIFILKHILQDRESSIIEKIFLSFFILNFILFPLLSFGAFGLFDVSETNVFILILGIACLIVSIICLSNMPKYNNNGRKTLGNILGFKHFLEVSEKSRIEQLIHDNPSYCFDIIPYAYVLGVSDVWIDKFKTILNEQPNWYYGRNFNSKTFNSLAKSMGSVSVPSTKNGGISHSSGHSGFSGGGFSGGGHGGGGGHSW